MFNYTDKNFLNANIFISRYFEKRGPPLICTYQSGVSSNLFINFAIFRTNKVFFFLHDEKGTRFLNTSEALWLWSSPFWTRIVLLASRLSFHFAIHNDTFATKYSNVTKIYNIITLFFNVSYTTEVTVKSTFTRDKLLIRVLRNNSTCKAYSPSWNSVLWQLFRVPYKTSWNFMCVAWNIFELTDIHREQIVISIKLETNLKIR